MIDFWKNTMIPLFKICMIAAVILLVLGFSSALVIYVWCLLLACISC